MICVSDALQENETLEQKASDIAMAYFRQGYNCAECVFLSYLDTHDTPLPRELAGIISGFGGGIGHTKHLCGAVSGAVLALGTTKGRGDIFADKEPRERSAQLRQDIYPHFADLVAEAKAHLGSLECAELTASHKDFDSPERRKGCGAMVSYCAALAARHGAK